MFEDNDKKTRPITCNDRKRFKRKFYEHSGFVLGPATPRDTQDIPNYLLGLKASNPNHKVVIHGYENNRDSFKHTTLRVIEFKNRSLRF